jgi:ferredoxin-NADP reductase
VLLTLPLREIQQATPRTRILRVGLDGQRFPYQAGQALLIADQGRQPRKPYSIAGSPEDAEREGCLELLVGVDAQGGVGPHLTLEAGMAVDVEGPVGTFTFPANPEETRFVFIAGGTGIAPLRSMLRHALGDPRRQLGLFYSARTPDDFAYQEELEALARAGRIELKLTVTRKVEAGRWAGIRGRIGPHDLAPLVHHPATLCFVCGPPALVDEMPRLLAELGVAPARIRVEEWG